MTNTRKPATGEQAALDAVAAIPHSEIDKLTFIEAQIVGYWHPGAPR